MVDRVLEPVDYVGQSGIDAIILPQTLGRSLSMKPLAGGTGRDHEYTSSEVFWLDVLSERLIAERVVTLRTMRLFEWFPRNPGLFYKADAKQAREVAQYQIMDIDQQAYSAFQANADAPPDHASLIRSITGAQGAARTKIFTPQGKVSMLQGGIGCVRFQPVRLGEGTRAWFMSATSGTAPDEGVPLLVPDNLYPAAIDRIRDVGFATVTITGRTRFIPEQFLDVYATKNGIPRLYVKVDELFDAGPDHDYGMVSVLWDGLRRRQLRCRPRRTSFNLRGLRNLRSWPCGGTR